MRRSAAGPPRLLARAADDMFAAIMRALNTCARARGAHTRTRSAHRCTWSCESRLLNDGLLGAGPGLGGTGGCGEVEVGGERQRCGGEDKLDVQKQTVFVPEAQ